MAINTFWVIFRHIFGFHNYICDVSEIGSLYEWRGLFKCSVCGCLDKKPAFPPKSWRK